MSETAKQFDLNSDPSLSNMAPAPHMGTEGNVSTFRNPIPSTSTANVAFGPPSLPPRPDLGMQQGYGMNQGYGYGNIGGYGMPSYGGYGGMGGYGGYGMGAMGGMGMSPYGGYNRFGMMHGDMESRFIQLAEENSRPAFDSIQGFVSAVGSVAMMLENTFFALTSSFRAILGVAENFGRLRSLFAQVWSTFAVVRTLNWMIRKLMVMLGIRTEAEFKAWAEAVAATQVGAASSEQRAKGSSWPILMFFGVVVAAPYLVLKMLHGLSSSINERLNDPTTWQNPLRAVAQHDFQATSPQEITFSANQVLTLAPQHLQNHLWNSGWLMASTDRQTAGLIPVNYIKVIKPNSQEGSSDKGIDLEKNTTEKAQTSIEDLNQFYKEEL